MLTDKVEYSPFVQNMVASLKYHQLLLNQYMHKIETFDPINYTNEYQRTPLHPVLWIHMGISTIQFDQTILEMEIFQHIISPSLFFSSLIEMVFAF